MTKDPQKMCGWEILSSFLTLRLMLLKQDSICISLRVVSHGSWRQRLGPSRSVIRQIGQLAVRHSRPCLQSARPRDPSDLPYFNAQDPRNPGPAGHQALLTGSQQLYPGKPCLPSPHLHATSSVHTLKERTQIDPSKQ